MNTPEDKNLEVNYYPMTMEQALDMINKINQSGMLGATPGGNDKEIQFNDGGVFGGDASLRWDKSTRYLYLGPVNPDDDSVVISGTSGITNEGTTVILQSGDGGTNYGGANMQVRAGSGNGNGNGGFLSLLSGGGGANGSGGNAEFGSSNALGSAVGGNVDIFSGRGTSGGTLSIFSGDGTAGNGGEITIVSGASTVGDGGNIDIFSGGGINGGRIQIASEDADLSDSGLGGALWLTSGNGGTGGDGGVLNITSGLGRTTGDGGHINITSGNGGNNGTAGNVNLIGGIGYGATNHSGDIIINLEAGSSGATNSKFKIKPNGQAVAAILDFDSIITIDKTFTLQNQSCTLTGQAAATLTSTRLPYADSTGLLADTKLKYILANPTSVQLTASEAAVDSNGVSISINASTKNGSGTNGGNIDINSGNAGSNGGAELWLPGATTTGKPDDVYLLASNSSDNEGGDIVMYPGVAYTGFASGMFKLSDAATSNMLAFDIKELTADRTISFSNISSRVLSAGNLITNLNEIIINNDEVVYI